MNINTLKKVFSNKNSINFKNLEIVKEGLWSITHPKDASLITSYNQNLNEHYKIQVSSALQTSKNYIQKTIPNDDLSYSASLSTKVNLYGYILTSIVKRLIKQDSVDITFDEALNIAKEYNDSLKGQTKIAI